MSATTTTPCGPAPRRAIILSHARFELGTLLRNGEQLLVSLILPLLALAAFTYINLPTSHATSHTPINLITPGVLALAITSTAFTGQAISTGFDRRNGVLRYLGVTPLGRTGLIWAKAIAVLALEVIQLLIISAAALALGWRPEPLSFLLFAPTWILGTWCFVAFALLLAGAMRAEAVLALANLIWVLLVGLGGILFPPALLPAWLAPLISWLPAAALGESSRAALLHNAIDPTALILLTAWAALATWAASRFFRWSD
ncbi:ABC transporter permease [Dermatophilus congolensis]|uniref:Transport permease protein n=3 Tax=Dermatophilus congolensis TaxID=1863 RepID=A0A239VLU4_9MICO|nr:ABC transporter permease [Dermatophilus congolensis]MBO3129488.1 ABC transporter permease [Dermatophilus congolensis]MBO3131879.1 ABC transporter permease [Dermatophilus congolensis]MBO3133964.1 ABC transporter permease [Dermatophilus congolensis]MBO3136195.1 ABC transporter permease [Dermatophilus congolensis]MBO3138441.1 ABC transporter permease [Dermatophilus congolensis]